MNEAPSARRTRIVVLGGGTAGWMSATALAKLLGPLVTVTLVESEDIGIVGVGEATLPHIRGFVERLGIDEAAFMQATHATYKLGIDFRDFGKIGESYVHPFGTFGEEVAGVPFHHYWLELQRHGLTEPIGKYSLAVEAALAAKFRPPTTDGGLGSTYGYAYQFDATLFGPFLREHGKALGVERIEGKVVDVRQDGESGDVIALVLESGREIEGDLFVDCSGFRSLLLGSTLAEEWEDWSRWLPCDRAAALPCSHTTEDYAPLTSAIAMPAGWRWQIPLQHRMGNGYVFSSQFISEDEACETIRNAVAGEPLAEPRVLRFRAGRRSDATSGSPQWRHRGHLGGAVDVVLRHPERLRVQLPDGAAGRFRGAPGVQAALALEHLPDAGDGRGGELPDGRMVASWAGHGGSLHEILTRRQRAARSCWSLPIHCPVSGRSVTGWL